MPIALLNGVLVLPPDQGGPRQTSIRFDQRQILSLGQQPRRGDQVIDLTGHYVYPGLVNAHDHLEMNHYPRTRFRPQYANAHQWGEDFLLHLDDEPFKALRKKPLAERCLIGGIKNLRSGVTTVAHHNPLHPPLLANDYPVRVVRRYGWAHSLHFTSERALRASYRRRPRHAPWIIHLAEGTDAVAAGELSRLVALGALGRQTVLVHGVGLTEADRTAAIRAGAGLVWCPSSNLFLLGQTAQVAEFSAVGKLAIGSDSRLTADGNLLDELRAAFNTRQLSPEALFRAVTLDAAVRLGLDRVGALWPGYTPDMFIVSARYTDPYRGLIDLSPSEIEAIYVGGRLVSGQTHQN